MALDTLTIVRRLEAAKIDRQQAEAIADVLHESEAGALADLATKADLREVKADLKALEQRLEGRIDALRAEMEARFESLEQRMTIKLGSMIVVALGVMAVLVKLL
jgi:hypothetical protein